MLPEALSNDICSLKPKVDRLTLSVDMEIDSKGKVVSYDIYESIIRSKERMVYTDISDMLEKMLWICSQNIPISIRKFY